MTKDWCDRHDRANGPAVGWCWWCCHERFVCARPAWLEETPSYWIDVTHRYAPEFFRGLDIEPPIFECDWHPRQVFRAHEACRLCVQEDEAA